MLTTTESLALQAMVRRAGFVAVLDDLALLASEQEGDAWQDIASRLGDLARDARELE
jgi:hypothetical protein